MTSYIDRKRLEIYNFYICFVGNNHTEITWLNEQDIEYVFVQVKFDIFVQAISYHIDIGFSNMI